jgi:hypothetical protein
MSMSWSEPGWGRAPAARCGARALRAFCFPSIVSPEPSAGHALCVFRSTHACQARVSTRARPQGRRPSACLRVHHPPPRARAQHSESRLRAQPRSSVPTHSSRPPGQLPATHARSDSSASAELAAPLVVPGCPSPACQFVGPTQRPSSVSITRFRSVSLAAHAGPAGCFSSRMASLRSE